MKKMVQTMWFGIRKPFKKTGYTFILLFLFVAMFGFFIFVPVWTVPANTLATQLSFFSLQDYVLLAFLSLLSSLFLSLQIYVISEKKKFSGAGIAVGGGVGTLLTGIGGVAGTAFCTSCLAPFFAIFGIGFGGVIFILEYRLYFVSAITILMILAIYLTAQKIGRDCSQC